MDLEKTAIERIRTASQMSLQHYGLPLVVTDSGGKDSAVCRELVRRSGVPFELMHNLTTADAPQTIYYVREQFQKAEQHRKSSRRPKGRKIREECIAGFSIHSCMNEISYRVHNNYVSKCICPYGVR